MGNIQKIGRCRKIEDWAYRRCERGRLTSIGTLKPSQFQQWGFGIRL